MKRANYIGDKTFSLVSVHFWAYRIRNYCEERLLIGSRGNDSVCFRQKRKQPISLCIGSALMAPRAPTSVIPGNSINWFHRFGESMGELRDCVFSSLGGSEHLSLLHSRQADGAKEERKVWFWVMWNIICPERPIDYNYATLSASWRDTLNSFPQISPFCLPFFPSLCTLVTLIRVQRVIALRASGFLRNEMIHRGN